MHTDRPAIDKVLKLAATAVHGFERFSTQVRGSIASLKRKQQQTILFNRRRWLEAPALALCTVAPYLGRSLCTYEFVAGSTNTRCPGAKCIGSKASGHRNPCRPQALETPSNRSLGTLWCSVRRRTYKVRSLRFLLLNVANLRKRARLGPARQ